MNAPLTSGTRLRPRDAATLILVDRTAGAPQVLMGHRSARHVFMPNTFVFPGGRVDPEDGHVLPARDLRPQVRERLMRAATARRARALGMAAVREAFEETGLALAVEGAGSPDDPTDGQPASWRPMFERGLAPRLDCLAYVFRAITPTNEIRRFNARFFLADARHVRGDLGGSGELIDLQWIPIDEAIAMPNAPGVTRKALAEVRRRVSGEVAMDAPVPVARFIRGRDRTMFD